MTDSELLIATLDRLGLTYVTGAKLAGMTDRSFQGYASGVRSVPPAVWRSLLEYEARIGQRQRHIAETAVQMGILPEAPKRRGRPRGSIK